MDVRGNKTGGRRPAPEGGKNNFSLGEERMGGKDALIASNSSAMLAHKDRGACG